MINARIGKKSTLLQRVLFFKDFTDVAWKMLFCQLKCQRLRPGWIVSQTWSQCDALA
jgi:hypothetical protein